MKYTETTPYYDMTTKNKSFINVHNYLKSIGVKNNAFHLRLINKELQGVDPYDPNLTIDQKSMIIQECKLNLFYYLREVVRIEDCCHNLIPFRLDKNRLAAIYCFYNNINFYLDGDRQTGKTTTINALLSHPYGFHNKPNDFVYSHPKLDFAKKNVIDIKNIIKHSPEYMNNDIKSKYDCQFDTIVKLAFDRYQAELTGRSLLQQYQYFDDIDFTNYASDLLYSSRVSYHIIAKNAERDGFGHCRMFTATTPIDLINDTLSWDDIYYDIPVSEFKYKIDTNSTLQLVYINTNE